MEDCVVAYVIARSSKSERYEFLRFDFDEPELLVPLKVSEQATFPKDHSLAWIGEYVLAWSPIQGSETPTPYFDYRLFRFDPTSPEPLSAPAIHSGSWTKQKFWGNTPDFGNPDGAQKNYDSENRLRLLPCGTFLLNFIPTAGRGTFALWNFDPALTDPTGTYTFTPRGSFRDIQEGDELYPISGHVLERKGKSAEFVLWVFDPSANIPLAHPAVWRGRLDDVGPELELAIIGSFLLVYHPEELSYRLFRFDPEAETPFGHPVRHGKLPDVLRGTDSLFVVEPRLAIDESRAEIPGTIDFMRAKIKHVVYYMLENRSFDHVCGWLYEHGSERIHFVGPSGPFRGANTAYANPSGETGDAVFQNKYKEGKLSVDYPLEMFTFDPYHDASDVLRQLFYKDSSGYERGDEPTMQGFVWNNGSPTVMTTYSPEQLPILNGLARHFSVSDEWFCSMPSATDVNRAFAISGNAQMQLTNFMSPPEYNYWPEQPHRPSFWKLLWAHGLTDFKIYNSTEWYEQVFTYQLFLEGQVPTIDAAPSEYVQGIDQFFVAAEKGTLPAVSFLEPLWIGGSGTTSYHPGADVVLGERQLNKIYEALRNSPAWEETLLVVTFDEHGGIFDHVPPPRAVNPYANDVIDGFRFDILGPRVPSIVVSPFVKENTVFRSDTGIPFDGTSFLSTLLRWCGIPKAQWFLGERVKRAPSFEAVLSLPTPRQDAPVLTPPYDKNFPPDGGERATPALGISALQRTVASHAVMSLVRGSHAKEATRKLIAEVVDAAATLPELRANLESLKKRLAERK